MHASLCDFLSDIYQNAVESGADSIQVDIDERRTTITFTVEDNGKGMADDVRRKVTDPFYTDGIKHAKRKVGLGIPFLIQAVDAVEGDFSLESQLGKGTTVRFTFPLDHIDCPPKGNMVSTLLSMVSFPGAYQLVVHRKLDLDGHMDAFELDRSELEELLGSFDSSGAMQLLRTYLQSQEAALDEIRNRG
ncbi:ATP-binding protein [Pleomorphochaeta sp. DL1XJH-081]|uniref:ATP-binding protein n=1 Tax=Pleomorphochaeta sp. DL1XJH-081 TaxID=3409690 RepID=UPI003BB62D8A